jgi:hypothetical protein
MYQMLSQYITNLHTSMIDGQKHYSTMIYDALTGTATPKMNKSFVHMAHVSSDCACAQDWYLKHPSEHYCQRYEVGQWLVFGWFWGWGTSDTQLARRKQAKKTHPNHGGCHCPMAVMVPSPRHRRMQQSANVLRNKSLLLKLENIIIFTIYLLQPSKGVDRGRLHWV